MNIATVEAFDSVTFFRTLKAASVRMQRAKDRSERNPAIDEVFDLIKQAKQEAKHLKGAEKQAFIARVETISGMKIEDKAEAAADKATREPPVICQPPPPSKSRDSDMMEPDLSGRLPRYVRPSKPGDPEMRVIQVAVKKRGGVTMILVIGEANNVFYVTQGPLGGEFQTWDTSHSDDARQQFNALRHEEGYQEMSPAALRYHRSMHIEPTTDSPNRRGLGPNATPFRRRRTDPE
jgi:hypothetical protein